MEIDDLYGLLPEMQCIPGCVECCRSFGVPSRTRVEDERLKAFLHAQGRSLGRAEGTTCPYASDRGCTVYPARPLICRLYGTSVNYRCRMGAGPVRVLDEDEEAEIFNFYQACFF